MSKRFFVHLITSIIITALIFSSVTLVNTDKVSASAKKYKIIFKANGGKVSKKSKKVTYKKKVGKLPYPTKEGYIFCGWYTKKKGGESIRYNHKYKFTHNKTLYARWLKKSEYISTIFNQINKTRVKSGKRKLVWNKDMSNASKIRVNEIQVRWSHIRPNASNDRSMICLIGKWDSRKNFVGEIFACGFDNADDAVDAWIKSKLHEKVLKNKTYHYINIAVSYNKKNEKIYVVCHFSD